MHFSKAASPRNLTEGLSASSDLKEIETAHNVDPIHYNIRLIPDIEDQSFTTEMELNFRALHNSNELNLHSVGLNITEASLQTGTSFNSSLSMTRHFLNSSSSNSSEKATEIIYNQSNGTITLVFDSKLNTAMEYQLNMEVQGKIPENITTGIIYSNESMITKGAYMLYSFFEREGARYVFPCVDEPSVRGARFSWEIVRNEDTIAISNTDIESSRKSTQNGKMITKFVKTPPMATYHNAFSLMKGSEQIDITNIGRVKVEGHFNLRQEENEDDIKYFKPALETLARGMQYFEEKFGVEYPFETIRLVFAPKMPESVSGVENFGMIAAQVKDLVVDENLEYPGENGCCYHVVMLHVAAHQWLGRIVSIASWDQHWIKEGLTQWMTYKTLRDLYPKIFESYPVFGDSITTIMLDSFRDMPPLELEHSMKINPTWQALWLEALYAKSVFVFNILSRITGDEEFIASLSRLINRHFFKTAKYEDVEAFKDAPGDTKKFLNTWIKNSNYPTITLSSFRRSESFLVLRQDRVPTVPLTPKRPPLEYPSSIDLISGNGKETGVILLNKRNKFNLDTENIPYVMFNTSGDRAYYEPYYPMKHLKRLAYQGKKKVMPADHRIYLLDQLKYDYDRLALLLDYWKGEDDSIVFKAIMDGVTALYVQFSKYMPDLTPASLLDDKLKWLKDTNSKNQTDLWDRNDILKYSSSDPRIAYVKYGCLFNHTSTFQLCSTLYLLFSQGMKNEKIEELRYSLMVHAVSYESDEIGQKAIQALKKIVIDPAVDQNERFGAGAALAGNSDKDDLYDLLDSLVANEKALAEEGPFFQTFEIAMESMSDGADSYRILWQWVKDRWDTIKQSDRLRFSAYRLPLNGLAFLDQNEDACSFYKERRSNSSLDDFARDINKALIANYFKARKLARSQRGLLKFLAKEGYLKRSKVKSIKPAQMYSTKGKLLKDLCFL